MYQIYLFAGLYGFFGSILIILFKLWPDVVDWRAKKKIRLRGIKPADREDVFKRWKFFPDPNEKTYEESQQTYNFYSTLWSFRLIGTGFMITIIYSIWPSEFLGLFYNPFFVSIDIFLLTFFPLFGIEDVRCHSIGPRGRMPIFLIFGFNLGIYFMLLLFNLSTVDSTRVFLIDNMLIISTAISQIIFTSLFVGRYLINKHKNF
jgi:hypothetical protein